MYVTQNSLEKGQTENEISTFRILFKYLFSIYGFHYFFFYLGELNGLVPANGPTTPNACDVRTTFDAVTTLRGEILFFKNR